MPDRYDLAQQDHDLHLELYPNGCGRRGCWTCLTARMEALQAEGDRQFERNLAQIKEAQDERRDS